MTPFLTSLTAKASETISFMRFGLTVMGCFLILLLAGCVVFTILTIKSKESSRSRNQTSVPCTARQILNHRTTSKALVHSIL